MSRALLGIFLAYALAAGCKKTGSAANTDALERPLLSAPAPGPPCYRWQRLSLQPAVGSVEVPSGEDWVKSTSEGLELTDDKLDITIIVGAQPDVGVDSRTEYMQSLARNNQRDAPKYQVLGRAEGQIDLHPAAVLDGTFDNGTVYVTRDYALFMKDHAVVAMVRGPVARTSEVRALADHVAQSFR